MGRDVPAIICAHLMRISPASPTVEPFLMCFIKVRIIAIPCRASRSFAPMPLKKVGGIAVDGGLRTGQNPLLWMLVGTRRLGDTLYCMLPKFRGVIIFCGILKASCFSHSEHLDSFCFGNPFDFCGIAVLVIYANSIPGEFEESSRDPKELAPALEVVLKAVHNSLGG
eukprot:scaffold37801_cov30-Attheya_sp.AAC.2